MKKIFRYFKRKRILLNDRHFYRNINAGFVHPHSINIIKLKELYNMSENDFMGLLGGKGYGNMV